MGNPILDIDGYRYYFVRNESKGLRNKWRCSRHSLGCKATAVTMEKNLVAVTQWHNHDQYPNKRRGSKKEPRFQ